MVVLLCLTVGVVFFDRNAINFLMPFIAPELNLSNTQIGLLASHGQRVFDGFEGVGSERDRRVIDAR